MVCQSLFAGIGCIQFYMKKPEQRDTTIQLLRVQNNLNWEVKSLKQQSFEEQTTLK